MTRPSELFGRAAEWKALEDFVDSSRPGTRLAVVAGRRRQGKTMLLQALVETRGGFYWQARQQTAAQNLVSFSETLGRWVGAPAPFVLGGWEQAIDVFVEAISAAADNRAPVAVIDEIGYLLSAVPGVASHLQAALSPGGQARRQGRGRIILCGSAFGEMRRLVDPDAPLRGRSDIELILRPFGFRESAQFWGVAANPSVAFRLHALVGGTPAYRDYAGDPPAGDIDDWAQRHLLNPVNPLFREGRVVIAEDPQLSDQALYWGVLGSIAGGAHNRTDIAKVLGRAPTSINHALSTVVDAGWVRAERDLLRRTGTRFHIDEPIVRFHQLVIEPNEARLIRRRDAESVWLDALPLVRSRIFGPHLEDIAKEWILSHATQETLGAMPSAVGSSTVRTPGGKIQLDLVVESTTARGGRTITAIGEVKATAAAVGIDAVERLRKAASSLPTASPDIKLLVVSASGFTTELRKQARQLREVELVDLARLFGDESEF